MVYLGPIPINIVFIVVCLIINIPIYLALGSVFFGGWEGFKQAIFYWIKPDTLSLMDGEYMEDKWAEMKLNIFFVICIALLVAEYAGYFGYATKHGKLHLKQDAKVTQSEAVEENVE